MWTARLRRLPAHVLTLALALLGAAAAQAPTYVTTGTLTATVDGVPVTFATFVTVVPEPSETIDDARARAVAGALVGREVATASAITTAPLVIGGLAAMPATLTVELRGSVGAPQRGREDLRELVLGIRLDPATLAWTGVPDQVSVAYHPDRWSGTAYYQLQDLVVLELTATATSPTALRVVGRLEATLVWREGAFQVRVDPSRTLALTVHFAVDPVVGDEALAALLGN